MTSGGNMNCAVSVLKGIGWVLTITAGATVFSAGCVAWLALLCWLSGSDWIGLPLGVASLAVAAGTAIGIVNCRQGF